MFWEVIFIILGLAFLWFIYPFVKCILEKDCRDEWISLLNPKDDDKL